MKNVIPQVVVAFGIVFFGLSQSANAQWGQQQNAAPVVTAKQIRELQADQNVKDKFIVVDVRAKAESDVSVIPGAITKAKFEQTANQHQGKAIIVYCTSGGRSAKYANLLKQKGWNAWNYKGSILDWCKNKLPLTKQDGTKTNRVHTYSRWNSVPREYQAVR